MATIIENQATQELAPLTENDIDRVSGGIPLHVGRALHAQDVVMAGPAAAHIVKSIQDCI